MVCGRAALSCLCLHPRKLRCCDCCLSGRIHQHHALGRVHGFAAAATRLLVLPVAGMLLAVCGGSTTSCCCCCRRSTRRVAGLLHRQPHLSHRRLRSWCHSR